MNKFIEKLGWLRVHRKKVVVHSLILSGFLLYCIFGANPIFDRLEETRGGASISYEIPLPSETRNILYAFGTLRYSSVIDTVDVRGWAFIKGQSAENSEIYVVLHSSNRTYVFDTFSFFPRRDVTEAFQTMNLNLDDSGFVALIPAKMIKQGEYTVGLYIRKGDITALQYTDRVIKKCGDTVQFTVRT